VIVDPDTGDFKAVENSSSMATGGAGSQASQTISNLGADILITGNVGPNAFEALKASGIKVLIGASGTVSETLAMFERGELEEISGPSSGPHAGMRA